MHDTYDLNLMCAVAFQHIYWSASFINIVAASYFCET